MVEFDRLLFKLSSLSQVAVFEDWNLKVNEHLYLLERALRYNHTPVASRRLPACSRAQATRWGVNLVCVVWVDNSVRAEAGKILRRRRRRRRSESKEKKVSVKREGGMCSG